MATAIENEIIGLEKKYWQAIKDQDLETAMTLTYEPCIVAGPQGVSRFGKSDFKKMMQDSKSVLKNFEIKDDAEVQVFGDDLAVLAYSVHEEFTIEGKPVSVDAAESSTWVRKNGKWLCAMHTESICGDPYGRDQEGKAGNIQ